MGANRMAVPSAVLCFNVTAVTAVSCDNSYPHCNKLSSLRWHHVRLEWLSCSLHLLVNAAQVAEISTLFDDDGILVRFMNSNTQGNAVR
jgi:hypothetical protein